MSLAETLQQASVKPVLKNVTPQQWCNMLYYSDLSPDKKQAINSLNPFTLLPVLQYAKTANKGWMTAVNKIFIFGAGGTTSWFLPKLLKIYNDLLYKRNNSFNIEIILIDKDVV
jgi:hypothetical protein